MNTALTCVRCHRETVALEAPPVPGPIGEEILERICGECWAEWSRTEVMVINELRLNFMDPEAQRILNQHMREFLGLEGHDAAAYTPPGEEAEESP